MQIKQIVLYGQGGRVRRLVFRPGRLNVIAGDSGTGKSAVINVVDYCLGRDDCPIPARVIRDAVSWYGLLLRVGDRDVFAARAAPVPPAQTTSEVYFESGPEVDPPPFERLRPNTNAASLTDHLTRLLGVSPNLHVPPDGQSRDPLEATIKHAKVFCFQYQDEIAKRDLLFHRQGEHFVALATRDTLPYFLGAVPEDGLRVRQELREAKRGLKMLERRLSEAIALSGAGAGRAVSLVREAVAVGLLPDGDVPADPEGLVALLREVRFTPSSGEPDRRAEELARLRRERAEARDECDRLRREIAEAEDYETGGEGFIAVAGEQRARLESINLMAGDAPGGPARCPLCGGEAGGAAPLASRVRAALAGLSVHLEAARRERPDLGEFLAAQREELTRAVEQLRANREATDALMALDSDVRSLWEQDLARARVEARVGLFLDSASTADEDSALRAEVERGRARVAGLEAGLSEDESEEAFRSAVSRVGGQVTRWCEELGLEYGRFPIRLDPVRLTLVADTDKGPVPMSQMGSGQNWLWLHLTAHFALHKLFAEKGRPVPRFLILDQPTQVYFPAATGVSDGPGREWARRLFRWLHDRVDELGGRLQVIVTDHAEVDEGWFDESVVERWRDGRALVPADWPCR